MSSVHVWENDEDIYNDSFDIFFSRMIYFDFIFIAYFLMKKKAKNVSKANWQVVKIPTDILFVITDHLGNIFRARYDIFTDPLPKSPQVTNGQFKI